MINKVYAFLAGYYKKLSFLQGVVLTICFSSLLSIAATNLPGFFVFSPGTPISSSEVNANIEKLAGTIVVKANFTPSISVANGDYGPFSDCPTCNSYRKKLNFDSISINDSHFKTATDNDANSNSFGALFSYYEVAADGWYEIRFIPAVTVSALNVVCTTSNCSHNINASINIFIAKNLASTGIYTSTSIGTYFSVSKNESDSNYDSVIDMTNNWEGQPPEIKRIYLKTNQVLFVKFDSSYNQTYMTADYTAGIPANSLDLTIIKL